MEGMAYVLLMTTWLSGYVDGPITTSAYFSSLQTCDQAGKRHAAMLRENGMKMYWTCNAR